MTVLTRLAAVALAAVLLTGCDGTPTAPTGPTGPVTRTDVQIDPGGGDRPEFRGRLDVLLQPGQIEPSDGSCTGREDELHACDRLRQKRYRLITGPTPAHLATASAELVGGGTSWSVEFRVTSEDRGRLRQVRESARATGAAVVVIGPGRRVLISAGVPDIHGRSITVTDLAKADAWDLVQQVEDVG